MTTNIFEGNRKALWFVPVLLFITIFTMPADDWETYGGYYGSFSVDEMDRLAVDVTFVDGILRDVLEDDKLKISQLHEIEYQRMGAELKRMLKYLESAILPPKYETDPGETYSHVVIRGETDVGFEGWVVVTYYASVSEGIHLIYYFEARKSVRNKAEAWSTFR